jgi:hypothetical protein
MTFLGVTFDTVSMTLEVTPERVVEISLLVEKEKGVIKRVTIFAWKITL